MEELQKNIAERCTIKPYYIQADFVNDAVKSVTDQFMDRACFGNRGRSYFFAFIKSERVILHYYSRHFMSYHDNAICNRADIKYMTLGAIAAAIGLIIDDAIVVVEQIHRTHEEHPDESSLVLVQKAINICFPAMVGSSLSTIVIFLPFMLMSGVAGAYFKVMTNTMIITLGLFIFCYLAYITGYLLAYFQKRKPDIKGKAP